MGDNIVRQQKEICTKYGATYVPANFESIAGVSKGLGISASPVHGLRHPPQGTTSGWFIWAGEYSNSDAFFEPVHISHLIDMHPAVVKFLGLGPGWRFLIAGDHIDVWFDKSILNPG